MKQIKWKWIGIGIIFIGVLRIGLLAPGWVLKWQDGKRERQIQFESVEEVKLSGDDSFTLIDKLKLFSGCDENAQVAELDISSSYIGKYESQMDSLMEQEYRKLADLELIFPIVRADYMKEGKTQELLDRLIGKRIFYVFDIQNPEHSMFVWEYMLDDTSGGIEVLNLEQQSGKLLGFAHITDILYQVSYTSLLECMERFLDYLGLPENPIEIIMNRQKDPEYVQCIDGEIQGTPEVKEWGEKNIEEMQTGLWQSMILFSLEDGESTFHYRVMNGKMGYIFGINKIF